MNEQANRKPIVIAGLLLGIGMGGFVDGILFHQLLQTHSMLSARLPRTSIVNIEVNMFWDGLFHTLTWCTTALGLFLLFRAGRQRDVPWSGKMLFASLLMGGGLFNLIEGVIDHHVLHVHHVMERLGVSMWDYGFLASGLVFLAAGWGMLRAAVKTHTSTQVSVSH